MVIDDISGSEGPLENKNRSKVRQETLKSQVKDKKRRKSRVKVKFSPVKTLTAVADLPTA